MNQINLIGRVGGEVELRHTSSGKAVAGLTLAVDDGYGENKKTLWLDVTLWGVTAETAMKYVKKGDRLGISGRLTQDEWEDKQTGKKQRKTKVTAESMHLISEKRDGPAPRNLPADRRQSPGMPAAAESTQDEDADGDIPF